MGHIVRLDAEGHLLYEGLLSSQEIATIDEILQALKEEIPQIEADLEETYGKSVLYKYNLGKILGELLTKYDISFAERRKFWDEIKNFATKEDRKRNEGTNAETRSFYGQCYRLSQYDQRILIMVKNKVVLKERDVWSNLANFIGEMVAKYAEAMDLDNLPDPDFYLRRERIRQLYTELYKEKNITKFRNTKISIERKVAA